MNVFQSTYHERLRSWRQLREQVTDMPMSEACVQIDAWWQRAPLVKYHLHPNDTQNWPTPWDILSENIYCTLTRAIGICYTVLMTRDVNVQLIAATDQQCEDHFLVLADYAKYIMNWWPNSVLSTTLSDFSVHQTLPISVLTTKIKL